MPSVMQFADINGQDLANVRAALKRDPIAAAAMPVNRDVSYLVRVCVRDWRLALEADEKVKAATLLDWLVEHERMHEEHAVDLKVGTLKEDIQAIYDSITKQLPSLKDRLYVPRWQTPNRRLIIFLAVHRYALKLATPPNSNS